MSNWKTNNQQYGQHTSNSNSLPKKKIGRSTVEYLQSQDVGNFIHEEQNIAKRERHGLFTQPLGLAPGDPYRDPAIPKPQKKVEVNMKMQQKVGPQLFSKPISTNLDDPYKDPFRANQLYIKEKNDLSIHPHGFMAGGKQKLVKNSEFEHQKQYNDKVYNTKDENGKIKTGPKTMMTNNMKRGYGSTTAGYLFSSYAYQGYPEEDLRDKDRKQKLDHKAKILVPFRGNLHPTSTFIPDYAVYDKNEPLNKDKDDEMYRGKSCGNWKYNNPNKKGYNGSFQPFPKYVQEGEKQKKPIKQEKPWIHNFNGTSKGTGETLSRPCVVPSQLVLNEIRRGK